MQEDFYQQRLAERYGIEVLLPTAEQMAEVDRVIFAELCRGEFTDKSRTFYLDCLSQLSEQGAEATILGCTEIGLLLADEQTSIPMFDSAELHVQMGLEWMLAAP